MRAVSRAEEAMAIQLRTSISFDRSSAVARYWLVRCEGFRVAGAEHGTVEEIVGEADPRAPVTLVVRRGWRRRNVPVAAVKAVVPAKQLILVGDDRDEARETSRSAAVATVVAERGPPVARWIGRVAIELGLLTAAVLVTLAHLVLTVVIRGARVSAAVGAQLAADMRAHRHAAAVRRRRGSTAATGRRPPTHRERRLSRAAVLGLERPAERRRGERR
jgi:hypothetical protein